MTHPPLTSEDSLVDKLLEFGRPGGALLVGIGDDAAVFRPSASEYLAVTTDTLLEDVDFRRSWISAAQLGHKALAVNLSDLAAMGVRPRLHTVSLALPPGIPTGWVSRFYRGMAALAGSAGARLAGGDLSRSGEGIQITITAIGETRNRRFLLRSGGKAGDLILVTGTLGAASAGLLLLERSADVPRSAAARAALRAQRTPTPRCAAGEWLARSGLCSAMMDLSDGLSSDLPRLCRASSSGARIDERRLPLFRAAAAWGFDPVRLALHGGEDFELLVTVPPDNLPKLLRRYPSGLPPLTEIGELTNSPGVQTVSGQDPTPRPLESLGWDHFKQPARRLGGALKAPRPGKRRPGMERAR
jgi:thiamine-monophosphate kinase